jgi:peptide subunit release factor 1 (eRF1)
LIFTLAMVPPLPIIERPPSFGSTFQLDLLWDFMETPVLVISAHAGDTFLGLALTKNDFEIQEIVTSSVKEKHSKGGWSQKRFERLREEDIRAHADAVVQKLSEMAGSYMSMAKYAVVGGDPTLLRMISPEIDLPVVERRLERHDGKRLGKLLGVVYGFTCYRC